MSVVMLTKTPLQANMSYIQAGRDRFESGIPAGSVSGLVWADKAGTLYLEESDDDGVTWSQTTNVSVSASTTTVLPWTALTKQQYRFRYVNGAAAQTKFRLVQQARGMELTTVDLSPLENRIDAITSGDTPATAQLTGSVESALGTTADVEATGNGSLIAIVKRLRTLLAGGLPAALTAGGGMKVGVVDALPAGANIIGQVKLSDGTDALAVNTNGSINIVPINSAGTELFTDANPGSMKLTGSNMELYGATINDRPAANAVKAGATFTIVDATQEFKSWMSDGVSWGEEI